MGWLAAQELTPIAGAREYRDLQGRLPHYADIGTTGAGLELIEAGLAIARDDARDGYSVHPWEDTYVAADAAVAESTCAALFGFEPCSESRSGRRNPGRRS